jgi:FAD/FMN-containing dehydrogenase
MNIVRDLLCIAKGEILEDDWSRRIYSVDASHYEIEPAAVVCPADEDDVQRLCEYASSNKMNSLCHMITKLEIIIQM